MYFWLDLDLCARLNEVAIELGKVIDDTKSGKSNF